MQDRFNNQMKLAELEEEKEKIELQIKNINRILYGVQPEPEKRGRTKKDSNDK